MPPHRHALLLGFAALLLLQPEEAVAKAENETVDCLLIDLGARPRCLRADGTRGVHCPQAGNCIPDERVCDGIVDCWDRSDEEHCSECKGGAWFCGGCGGCVAEHHLCDGYRHCANGDDEEPYHCPPGGPQAAELYVCMDNTTRRKEVVCDGIQDCERPDDDEGACKECGRGALLCEGVCIKAALRCDGIPDCRDASDEVSCLTEPTPTPTPTTTPTTPGAEVQPLVVAPADQLCWLPPTLTVLALALLGGAVAGFLWYRGRRQRSGSRRFHGGSFADFGEAPFDGEGPTEALAFEFRSQADENIYEEPSSRSSQHVQGGLLS